MFVTVQNVKSTLTSHRDVIADYARIVVSGTRVNDQIEERFFIIPEGTKVKFEIKDISILKERLKKYKGILKVNISSGELNELYHEYVSERTDIP